MKTFFEIKIKGQVINSIDDLNLLSLAQKEKDLILAQLLKLLNCVSPLPENEGKKVDLKTENEFLKRKFQGAFFNNGIDKVLLSFYEKNFSYAAGDILMNPDPVNVHCTQSGKGVDFIISVSNILAIQSDERGKNIYLKEEVQSKRGDNKRYTKISANASFDELLFEIQKRGTHLILANRSIAVNIHYYILDEKNILKLNEKAPKDFNQELKKIKIDKLFNAEAYHQRKWEIEFVKKNHQSSIDTREKIEEITRYKNSLLITKP